MNRGWFCERSFRMSFCHPRHNRTEKFFSRTSFQSRCVSHVKITKVHVGTIHQNVRVALQFSYQFAILISVCNFTSVCNTHLFVYSSYVALAIFTWVYNFNMSLQFSYEFAILTSRLQHFLHMWLHMDSMSL
jgi:hypothetical protein